MGNYIDTRYLAERREALKQEILDSFLENFPHYEEMTESFEDIRFEEEEIELWEDDEFVENISSQVIYSEGQIDRMNYKGDYAVNYYFRATFNGKELMHTMYFQGEREHWRKGNYKVPQSKLNEWFYR